jgi:phosphoribosylformimino-5-aminoimidazole carboxamide ribotide isomerase
VAVLIPSIDLMGGKIVQLVQGETKKLEFDNFDYWIHRFSKYPMVQLIDLDAARGVGDNRSLVKDIVGRIPCQLGGGIRDPETAQELLNLGARKVIIGSALLTDGRINRAEAELLLTAGVNRQTSPPSI